MSNPNDLNLIANVTEIYFASDGTPLVTTGSSIFHAQSNYANLLSVYIEDGTASDTTTLINFTPTNSFTGKVPSYTSHWFFMSTEGIVQKTIDGETRSFVHFYIKVPNIVLRYNSGSQQVQNIVTVIQRYGSNYVGSFSSVTDLRTTFPDELDYIVSDTVSNLNVLLTEAPSIGDIYEVTDNTFTIASGNTFSTVTSMLADNTHATGEILYISSIKAYYKYNTGSTSDIDNYTLFQSPSSFATSAYKYLGTSPSDFNNWEYYLTPNNLNDGLYTAYVIEDGGFFQVIEDDSQLVWTETTNIQAALQTKQYNTFNVNVQAGLSSTLDVTPIETLAAQMIMNAVANVEADFVNTNSALFSHTDNTDNPHNTTIENLDDTTITSAVNENILRFNGEKWVNSDSLSVAEDAIFGINGRLSVAEAEIVDLENTRLLKDGSNADNNITIRDVTFNLDVDTDAIQQTDFAAFSEQGKTNLNAYIDSVQDQLDDKLSQTALGQNFYNKTETNDLLDEKAEIVHTHLEADITDLDKYSQSEVDGLLDTKSNVGHTHVEADITDLDKYSTSQADTKFMAKETYVDVNDKILLSKLPDTAKQQTYVVTTVQDLPSENLINGEKAYVTADGDSYIWDGVTWLILSKADWENVSLDWANITNAPKANGDVSLANGVVYNKSQADTLLSGKSNVGHTHVENDITDLDKYTQAQVDTLLTGKANTSHTHLEIDITDLDKYTQAQVDTLLDGKANTTHSHVEADITDLDKYTQAQVDTLLTGKSDVGHTHTESDITDLDKYTQAQVDTLLTGKSDTGHTHVEADITDLDKYTQTETDNLLLTKVDKNISTYTEVTAFNDQDTYYVYQDGAKKVNLANLKAYLTSELEGITFQIVTADVNGLPDVQNPLTNTIYLVPSNNDAPDVYFEYLYIGNTFEYLGNTDVDLTNYYNKTEIDTFLDKNFRTTYYPNTKNISGSTIPKGAVVQFVGSQGDFITIKQAVASEINAFPKALMGLAENDIPNDEFGNVVLFGNITEVSLNALNVVDGDILWFDTVNGGLTKTEPSTNKIVVAAVQKAGNNSNGILLVRPDFVTRTISQITGLQDALNAKSDVGHGHIISDVTGLQNALDGKEPANANIQTHISSTSNPHSVTSTQVGLGNVLNYGIASQAEAEAGTSNEKYMTPLRTAQAIEDAIIDGGTF